ncbi:amidohydrolase family protein [Algiphilus aromaticivorans]|uniref:amidohydrolase family protein n=1 Tax=Algiphilus aromaticivorans TaxID=382454 RepID=UPI0005C17FDC|nr:amidohydrolase family protein [Algiphilus aromaticivorans]
MIIDAWAQHPTARMLGAPFLESLRRWTGGAIPDGELPLSMTLEAMDAGGVGHSLLSAWQGPQGALISNDEVASWVAQAPERLSGIGSVDISQPMQAVKEIRRCVRELGFKGIRVLPWLWELPPTHARFYPVYAECCELGVPFCTQVGHTGPLKPSEYGRPIPYIDQIALDFPELVIVGGHIGYPWTEEMVAVATKHSNVYIDTSAYTVRRYPPELIRYLKANGRKKVLFGSNWPMIAPAKALAELDSLGLDAEIRADFLGGNAARVFGINALR